MAEVPLVRNAALVVGLPAVLLARLATDAHRQGRFDSLPAQDRDRVLATIAALEAAAEGWRTSVNERRDASHERIAVAGSGEAGGLDGVPQSRHIDVNEAARMLNLTPRQVRNLAPQLGGVQVGGRWLFDVDAVTAESDRRSCA